MALALLFTTISFATTVLSTLSSELILSEALDALRAIFTCVMSLALAVRFLLVFTMIMAHDSTFVVTLTAREPDRFMVGLVIFTESSSESWHL
jgi:hypothetical protein